jgi:hypothetical protein
MMHRGLAGPGALAVLLMLVIAACAEQKTVEQQIIATIRAMEQAIENGERRTFMNYIAEDFSGQDGSMNREQVRALVVVHLRRYQQLNANLLPILVEELGQGAASAHFKALVTGGPGWIPESGQVYRFDTRWRLDNDEWLLLSADWTPVPLEEAL